MPQSSGFQSAGPALRGGEASDYLGGKKEIVWESYINVMQSHNTPMQMQGGEEV
jgi:hypothetical protein